ncbi:MAG: HAD-IIB family hydrolase [Gemmatimonadetes bacterium]|nr:HAD-IIB family hydrolase [Gemmatimonadota bacterium]
MRVPSRDVLQRRPYGHGTRGVTSGPCPLCGPGGIHERLPSVRARHRAPAPGSQAHRRPRVRDRSLGRPISGGPGHPHDPHRDGPPGAGGHRARDLPGLLPGHAGDLPQQGHGGGLRPHSAVLRGLPGAQDHPVERGSPAAQLRPGDPPRRPRHRRARQGPGVLAGHGLRAGRGAHRVRGIPGRRRGQLQPRDAGAPGPSRGGSHRGLRLREGLLRPRVGPPLRAADPPVDGPSAGGVHAPHRGRSVHHVPVVVPLRAVRGVRGEVRPGAAHAPGFGLGTRDRDALRGAPPPGAGAHLPGGAGRALRAQAPGTLAGRRHAGPAPDGVRRHQAPPAHPGRQRRPAEQRPAAEPPGGLPAGGRGRHRRQLRGGHHERFDLRPPRGGEERRHVPGGAPQLHPGVHRRSARGAAGPELGPGVGRGSRLGRAPPRSRPRVRRDHRGGRIVTGPEPGLVVFTDLDATLLDETTYSFEPAREALAALADRGIPLVLCSSKTRGEMERLAQELERAGLRAPAPLVAENGGSILWPGPEGSRVEALGVARERLVAALAEIARETGAALRGFATLPVGEVAALTGLTEEAARDAMAREHDEPFLVDSGDLAAIAGAADRRGLRVTRGGRFHHLTGPVDKGDAVRAVLAALCARGRAPTSMALGDAANDLAMLMVVDRPIVVPKRSGEPDPELARSLPGAEVAPAPGPEGWNAAVMAVLRGARLLTVATVQRL